MAEVTRNLCAQIPVSLHSRIRQEQEASGQTLSAYMTQLITNYYHMKEDKESMNTETRTVAFQVPPELFEKFKAYLQRTNLKQKEFFLACIQPALSDEAAPETAEQEPQDTERESEPSPEQNPGEEE